jgi:HD-GYP domain-containing protein (c-di-GMP phosphodiesterase class II)
MKNIMAITNELVEMENEVELELRGDYFYLNDNRINYSIKFLANFDNLTKEFRKLGLGSITFLKEVSFADIKRLTESITSSYSSEDPYNAIVEKMTSIDSIMLGKIMEFTEDDSLDIREAVKKKYFSAVSFTRGIMNQIKSSEKVNLKKSKRMVSSLVEHVIEEEQLILGMTAIKDFDEYTFHHSVNVSILSIALGQRLGFSKKTLVDLGIVALFHDIGKMEVPDEILNKPFHLTNDEWKIMHMHPVWGIRSVLKMRGLDDLTIQAAITAFEHHMNYDLKGYPKMRNPIHQDLFSRIVSISDHFDAMTSSRVYSRTAMAPDEALRVMMEGAGSRLDPLLLKFFINLVGVFPIGTVVMLDSKELGLVYDNNKLSISRPRVMIITDNRGNRIKEYVVSLMEKNAEDAYKRSIIKTVDASTYKINLAEFLL